uniref:Uncharacterized protein n=1 Tax=Arundo donax TaxID=35708 RepID=A0A0A9FE60_ARUDO
MQVSCRIHLSRFLILHHEGSRNKNIFPHRHEIGQNDRVYKERISYHRIMMPLPV